MAFNANMPTETFFNNFSFNGRAQGKFFSPVTIEFGPLTHIYDINFQINLAFMKKLSLEFS